MNVNVEITAKQPKGVGVTGGGTFSMLNCIHLWTVRINFGLRFVTTLKKLFTIKSAVSCDYVATMLHCYRGHSSIVALPASSLPAVFSSRDGLAYKDTDKFPDRLVWVVVKWSRNKYALNAFPIPESAPGIVS